MRASPFSLASHSAYAYFNCGDTTFARFNFVGISGRGLSHRDCWCPTDAHAESVPLHRSERTATMVGLFFTGSAVIGILVSQFLASRSDKRGDRKITDLSLLYVRCLGLCAVRLEP
ncbi:Sugar efflux transporter B [Serratia fonticola]|uniref:Sugar efflux transporter B n=1 Tax=Serratia fonticola TaxID=47917 RepID=A0A4V6KPM3_SERFO|nr:Sugar efflux transporter B [Serratia fonticola]